MFERFTRKSVTATSAALLAALGVGGVALAQSNSQAPAKTPAAQQSQEVPGQESNAPENSAADPDNVQQGDQNEPAGSEQKSGTEKESGTEQGSGTEKESGTEQESGSEKANDDGPGGHADEPGNPNADHQAQGKE